MGFVALLPFVDAIASLLLFDCNNQPAMPASSSLPPSVVPSLLALPNRNSNSNSIVQSNTQRLLYRKQHDVIGNEFTTSPASVIGSSVDSRNDVWNLPNGRVQFDRPLSFAGIKFQDGTLKSDDSSTSSSISLWDPVFLGSGGSGAVFSFSTQPHNPHSESTSLNNKLQSSTIEGSDRNNVAIKVSWKRSRESVQNECNILQSLEGVPHVEKCIGRNPYPFENGRVMIALSPVVSSATSDDITSSLRNVKSGQPQLTAVQNVVETMVGMLKLGIYTIDVQPLINVHTGDVLFIDFTEAKQFSNPLPPSDESALVGFCSEMIALIPDSLRPAAAKYLVSELNVLDKSETPLSEKVADILESMWLD